MGFRIRAKCQYSSASARYFFLGMLYCAQIKLLSKKQLRKEKKKTAFSKSNEIRNKKLECLLREVSAFVGIKNMAFPNTKKKTKS